MSPTHDPNTERHDMAEDETGSTENEETVEEDTSTNEKDTGAGKEGDDSAKDGKEKAKASTYKAPTESEWKAQQEKTKRANAQAAAHRKEADELKRKGESTDEAKVRETTEAASKAAKEKYEPIIINQAARAALREAGLTGSVDTMLRLIDKTELEIDEDGSVEGLDAQIRDMKKEFPDRFGKRTSARVDGSDRGKDDARPGALSTATQRLMEQARGR